MKDLTPTEQARQDEARNLWVATVRSDGRPHLVPVWFVREGGKLYVCTSPESVKGRNLDTNANIAAALEDGSHPLICEGTALAIGLPWPEEITRLFSNKYDWDITDESTYTLLVEITPRKWLTW